MTVRTLTMIHASRVRSSSIAILSCKVRSKIARREIVSNEPKSTKMTHLNMKECLQRTYAEISILGISMEEPQAAEYATRH
jgi:hypothetical protein